MESLIETTPSGLNAEEMFGYDTKLNNFPGVLALVFKQKTSIAGFVITKQLSLATLSWPNLVDITGIGVPFGVSHNSALTSISAPSLVSVPLTITVNFNPVLTTFYLPKLVSVGTNLNLAYNPVLSDVNIPRWSPNNGRPVTASDCALSQISVDLILARCVSNAAYVSGTVNLSGGLNSAPGPQGLIDKATLISRGVNVNTN